jgi:Tfp pilus assembly protein PilF
MERIEKLRELLRTNSNDPFIQHALALEYIKIGDETSARKLFEEILINDSQYIGSYYHLGKLLERMGDRATAIEWYQKGILAAKDAGDQHTLQELKAAFDDLTI